MDRLFRKSNFTSEKTPLYILLIFAALFSTGCVTGTLFACAQDSSDFISELAYSLRFTAPDNAGFLRFAVCELIPYAVLLVLGFAAFGVVLIPAVSFAKGFSFAFSFSAFVRVFPDAGVKWVILLFISEAIVMIPALFSALDTSFLMSLRLARSLGGMTRGFISGRRAVLTLVLCIASVISASILKIIFFPHIISASIL